MSTLAALALLAACATNPATGEREFSLMSEAQEIAIGQEAAEQVRQQMGLYNDQQLQQYVSNIGQTLAKTSERPDLPWHFAVVDSPAINAFALPGGYIYVTRGILAYLADEAQLAGVMGHEVGHVTARHAAQQYSRATGAQLGLVLGSIFVPEIGALSQVAEAGIGLLFLKYGRDDELQADELGTRYAARAGWDPAGVAGMLQTLDRIDQATEDNQGVPNWLSTHPAPADRVEKVQAAVKAAAAATPGPPTRSSDRAEFLRRIDGIVYGDSVEQGLMRGNTFLHAPLRFALDFPRGWEVMNSATQVVGKAPDANVFIVLQLVEKPAGGNVEEVAINMMRNSGFRPLGGDRTRLNGLDAFVGTYQGAMEGLGNVGVRAAHVAYNNRVYMVAGIAPAQLFEQAEDTFASSVRSFRALSAAEAERIRPNRIDLYTVRNGDSWASIAEGPGRGLEDAGTLALMNGHAPNQPPRAGDRVKIVVSG